MAEPKDPKSNPNVRKFLDFLGKAEGADYNVIVGGGRFDDYSRHPGVVGLRTKYGPSTAAGKYQITKTTYDDIAPRLGITDFSPQSQDRIALELIKQKGALADIKRGNWDAAIGKLGSTWASLPSSPYTQPKRSEEFVRTSLGEPSRSTAAKVQPKPAKPVKAEQQTRTTGLGASAAGASSTAPGPSIDQLPENYRLALAANYIADTEDNERSVTDKAMEFLEQYSESQSGSSSPNLQKAFQSMAGGQSADPFALMRQAQKQQEQQAPRRAVPRMPVRFADGGEVDPADLAEQMTVGTLPEGKPGAVREVVRDLVRGSQYLPYDLVGMPVDIATMAMRPFGYNVEKPFMGSEYLIDKAVQAGIANKPTGSTAETTARIGMGFVNPLAAARQIPRGLEALRTGAETAGTAAVRKITGKPEITTEQIYGAMAEPKGILQLGAPAISRAPGGTFMSTPEANITKAIDSSKRYALKAIGEEDIEKVKAAEEMFTKKALDFFEKKAGSVQDELKQELLAGRIKLPENELNDVFPRYLIDQAVKGELAAMRDIERRYDQMLGITQTKLPTRPIASRLDAEQELASLTQQEMLSQYKKQPELIPDDLLFKLTNKDPVETRIRIKENPEYFSTVIEPKLQRLINIKAQVVSPEDVTNYPSMFGKYAESKLGPNELEALKRNQPLLDISTPYPEFFSYPLIDLAEQAAKMSTAELKSITFPKFIARATALAAKQKGITARTAELEKNIKSNKPLDKEFLSFGTTEFQKLPNEFEWRKIIDPDATIIQSAAMNNSISGYSRAGSYGPFNNGRKALEDGSVELFVLYKDGLPVTHIEMVKGEKSGKFSIRQAQGNGLNTGNVFPDNYLPEVKAFINKAQPEDIPYTLSSEMRYINAPEGFAKGGMVDKPLYDRAA